MGKSETRQFKMHPAMLFSVIERQAGTLQKAILEGVMNSIDASATKVDVAITPSKVVIEDDGRGFRSKEEVESFFEVFGLPHDEKEDKTYGTFRMGRGQLFSFGRNQWMTGKFHMGVDIKGKGLDYDLHVEAEDFNGCRIEIDLYEQLSPSVHAEVERTIAKWVCYAPVPVTVNGKVVSKDPALEKWDIVTDEAYIRIRESGVLTIYNLGMFVCDVGSYSHGVAGEIISRKQLKINFARNDDHDHIPSSKFWHSTPIYLISPMAGHRFQFERKIEMIYVNKISDVFLPSSSWGPSQFVPKGKSVALPTDYPYIDALGFKPSNDSIDLENPVVFNLGMDINENGYKATGDDDSESESFIVEGNMYTLIGSIEWTDNNGDYETFFKANGIDAESSFLFKNTLGSATNPIASGSSIDKASGVVSINFSSGAPEKVNNINVHYEQPEIGKPNGKAWGSLTGEMADQEDLKSALDAKQKSITVADVAPGSPDIGDIWFDTSGS